MPYDAEPEAEITARDRMIRLRDFLAELPDDRFNMLWWSEKADLSARLSHRPQCGTVHCIGGWADVLLGRETKPGLYDWVSTGEALGLTQEQAHALFFPTGHPDWTALLVADAVRVIDHYLATGEINWGV